MQDVLIDINMLKGVVLYNVNVCIGSHIYIASTKGLTGVIVCNCILFTHTLELSICLIAIST